MPIENGWGFIDWYSKQQNLNSQLYILSSSTHSKDITKSQEYQCIKGYLEKPLSKETLSHITN